MFLFYVLSFFKKGDTIQGGTLFKGRHYLKKYGMLAYSWNNYVGGKYCLYKLATAPFMTKGQLRVHLAGLWSVLEDPKFFCGITIFLQ